MVDYEAKYEVLKFETFLCSCRIRIHTYSKGHKKMTPVYKNEVHPTASPTPPAIRIDLLASLRKKLFIYLGCLSKPNIYLYDPLGHMVSDVTEFSALILYNIGV